MAVTAGDLLPTIKKLAASFVEEIGGSDGAQNTFIFTYLNHALRKLANIAYVVKVSDVLSVDTLLSPSYVDFKVTTLSITDMYAPIRIMRASSTTAIGSEVSKRTSFADTTAGWWRESAYMGIHMTGVQSDCVLHYIAYPTAIGTENSPIQFPDAGTMGLCYYVAALIVESLPNAKELATHYYTMSERHLKVAVQANTDGRGNGSAGYVPSLATVDLAYRG